MSEASTSQRYRVVGAFADDASARAAVEAFRSAGIDDSAITIAGGTSQAPPLEPEREERFIGRLVLIVVAWSIVGTGIGVVMGLVLNALEIGPGGRGGLLIQVATWAIFAHLIAGMWAGYALLTKGESREPVRHLEGGRVLVSVWCSGREEIERIGIALRNSGAGAVAVYDSDGRLQITVHLAGE